MAIRRNPIRSQQADSEKYALTRGCEPLVCPQLTAVKEILSKCAEL